MSSITAPIDPQAIGDVLNYILTSKSPYKDYTKTDQSNIAPGYNPTNYITKYIEEVLQKYFGISVGSIQQSPFININNILPGDIITINNTNQRFYIVTQVVGQSLVTWPRLNKFDSQYFKNGLKSYIALRPDYTQSTSKIIDIAKQIVNKEQQTSLLEDTETFFNADHDLIYHNLGEGTLQIGDLIFLVDPTQLTFTCQNGYQYFPTLRTQGNPKIPSMQQVKNISVTLIFPNEDSINYQLLNLYAMFKRCPFVNIRNKDISEFFREICFGEWLSVALESIQIQSVRGFPNTLQADISLLPFDHKMITNGFQSLLSINDVKKQQAILYNDKQLDYLIRKSEAKLNEQSISSERFVDLVFNDIKKSPDFKDSLPFRAFYQSLIKERKFVCDNNGLPVQVFSNGIKKSDFCSLEKYRPVKDENFLHEYRAGSNNNQLEFSYSYLSGDFQSISALLSNERLSKQSQTLNELNALYNNITNKADLARQFVTIFANTKDLFQIEENKMHEATNNVIPELLTRFQISVPDQTEKEIKGVFGWVWRGIGIKLGIRGVVEGTKDVIDIINNKAQPDSLDIVGYKNGIVYNGTKNLEIDNDNGVVTLENSVNKIWEWINNGTPEQIKIKKKDMSIFIVSLRQEIMREIGLIDSNEMMIINPTEEGDLFKVKRLPLNTSKIVIDNKNDIVTDWSLVYSNKFIPINLQAFKYPYYQHIGSEDPVMSLNITSIPGSDDLKTKLSLLSERLYETVKTVTMTAPELITYLDSRVKINVSDNNIFNCFGVKKVVFDSFNSNTIDGQPGSWSTRINLTQSNFTIAQYHNVTQIPTNDLALREIAKLIACTEKVGNSYLVKHYSSNDVELELDQIIKLRFLKSKYGNELINHIKKIQNDIEIDYQTRKNITDIRKSAIEEGYGFYNPSVDYETKKHDLIGQDIIDKYISIIENKVLNVKKNVNATNSLNLIASDNKEFSKILDFIIGKMNKLFEQKLDILKNIIKEDRTWFQLFIDNLTDTVKGNWGGSSLVVIALSILLLPTLGPAIITAGVVGSAIAVGTVSIAGLLNDAVGNKLKKEFSQFFNAAEDTYTASVALEFANKIIKDPIIYNKLISPDTVGNNKYDIIENSRSPSRVNCYGDFDIPIIEDMYVGPDFYLYNNLVNNLDIKNYINAATNRYAKVGKLCMMMSLEETTDSIKKYDEIIKRTETIDETIKSSVKKIVVDEYNSSDLNSLLEILDDVKNNLAVCNNDTNEAEQISLKYQEYLNEFEKKYKNKLPKEEYNSAYEFLSNKFKKAKNGLTIDNANLKKLNLIYTARMKTILEIFDVYSALNSFMIEKSSVPQSYNSGNKTKSQIDFKNKGLSKGDSEEAAIFKLFNMVSFVLSNAETLTSETLASATWGTNTDLAKAIKKELVNQYENGLAAPYDSKYISLPAIQNIQTFLYNRIGFYVRLNSFLKEYNSKGGNQAITSLDLTTLPELRMLDFWNFRAMEENQRKIKITKEFEDSYNHRKDTTIKMFPTFKLFFIEEDKGFLNKSFNDYYTHNAIQSIEISANKNNASKTAVIRISNVTNSLTDRMALLRESEELFGYNLKDKKEPDNIFLGTLDIKPGTAILIKAGYAPYDNFLVPIFQGRIIEMNNGPVTELICQSYGAQLNHEIIAEKFGILSTAKEHGDIASSALDLIPGLEKLGKKSLFSTLSVDTFSGKNIRNVRGKIGDKFLLSNLIGNVSSATFALDNPRDENIYLKYGVSTNIYHRPTFDWVIYEQTVWEALREICLYHRNTISTVKPFNNDSLSNSNDIRESIVIGDKTGFYKFTDSFGLSSLSVKEIDEAVYRWNKIREYIFNNSKLYDKKTSTTSSPLTRTGQAVVSVKLTSAGVSVYDFFQNRINALVIVFNIISSSKILSEGTGNNPINILVNSLFNNKSISDPKSELAKNIITFSRASTIYPDSLHDLDLGDSTDYYTRFVLFTNIIRDLKKYIKDTEFIASDYYNVKDSIENTDEKLLYNPQYKKIQQHHLITDISDIISNNISLNGNFSNMVNVYYPAEPQIQTATMDKLSDDYIQKRLNVWTVKAFGDQKDEFARPLNSYQKNIDTNWWDINEQFSSFLQGYSRSRGKNDIKKLLTAGGQNNINLEIPNWNIFPSFVVVGVSLLQREAEKMYQGTIEIVGNPNIEPFDILHIQDYTNDMHGVVEVEEVVHTFTPDRGFRTIITPNLITFDRDPIQLQDTQIIGQIFDYANNIRIIEHSIGIASSVGLLAGSLLLIGATPVSTVVGGLMALGGVGLLYNSTIGIEKKYNKFIYDQMGNILGRDCINFSSLLYHGMPFMTGFDGVDYTNIKTLMNHNVSEIKSPITRYLAFKDTFRANMSTGWNPEELTVRKYLKNVAEKVIY